MDIGIERAGFTLVGCLETDPDARATIESNRPNWPLMDVGDVNTWAAGLTQFPACWNDLDLLVGGPPCQPFSKAAQWNAPRPGLKGSAVPNRPVPPEARGLPTAEGCPNRERAGFR